MNKGWNFPVPAFILVSSIHPRPKREPWVGSRWEKVRSCFPSRAHINYKKVYTFLNFGVHLSGVCCTPFHRKVYTFFNLRALV